MTAFIAESPFLLLGRGETLRVNGQACVIRDEEILAPLAADGKLPPVKIAVEVQECSSSGPHSVSDALLGRDKKIG